MRANMGRLAQLRKLRLKEYVCFIIRCLQSFGQRPAIIFSHAVLPFQKIGDILRFDAYFNTAQAGQQQIHLVTKAGGAAQILHRLSHNFDSSAAAFQ